MSSRRHGSETVDCNPDSCFEILPLFTEEASGSRKKIPSFSNIKSQGNHLFNR